MTLEEYKEQLEARLRELTNARVQTVQSVSVLDGAIAECQMQLQRVADVQVVGPSEEPVVEPSVEPELPQKSRTRVKK